MRRQVWFIAGIYVYLWQQLKPHTVNRLRNILSHFVLSGTVSDISPLGNGLVNDTYRVTTAEPSAPDYVLQRINHAIFRDVARLQANIEAVTRPSATSWSSRVPTTSTARCCAFCLLTKALPTGKMRRAAIGA